MAINWGPLGKEVYERTYSRTKPDGSKETWPETVRRVVAGNLALVPTKHHEPREREKLVHLLTNFAALPAGRHLWVSGVKGRQFIFNCHTAGWTDKIEDHYAFTFDELMKGGGVGANYSNKYIGRYNPVANLIDLHVVCDPAHADHNKLVEAELLSTSYSHEWAGCVPIEDSREGWVEALRQVLQAAFNRMEFTKGRVTLVLDASRIRHYGAIIRGFGGTASGPLALLAMLHEVVALLNIRLGKQLTSLDFMEIDHRIACCVVAGNVRRSARMSIKHWADSDISDFIKCKSDSARVAHWTTNISVEVDNAFFEAIKLGEEVAKKVYKECIDSVFDAGEPGFWNSSLAQLGEAEDVYCTNPCGEISMEPWENCNLGHVNLNYFYNDPHGAKEAFRLMTRFLIRATFSETHNLKQREVVRRNRRIGVGFFGYQGWVCKQGIKYSDSHRSFKIRRLLREFYSVIDNETRRYCSALRIPECIKKTALAPTGTIAKLAGASESAQAIFGRYIIRIVRYASNDPKLVELKEKGHYMEPDLKTPNTTCVYFYCKDILIKELEDLGIDTSIVEDQGDLTAEDCLAVQAMLQREFVDNSISYTVNLKKSRFEETRKKERKKLYYTLLRFLPDLKGATIMIGAGDRKQPPYTRVTKKEFEYFTGPHMVGQGSTKCSANGCPIK